MTFELIPSRNKVQNYLGVINIIIAHERRESKRERERETIKTNNNINEVILLLRKLLYFWAFV